MQPLHLTQGNFSSNQQQPFNPIQGGQQWGQEQQSITKWNQHFIGDANTPQAQWKHSIDNITMAEHTQNGIMAHELAHRNVGLEHGLEVGAAVVDIGADGTATSGHVKVQTPEVDFQRAQIDSGYMEQVLKQQAGLIAMAEAPLNQIKQHAPIQTSGLDSNGYGALSFADKDIANKAKAVKAQLLQGAGGQKGRANGPKAQNPISQQNMMYQSYLPQFNAQKGGF